MLYILDANVLITAHNTYYPVERVPEFWGWIFHRAQQGHAKLPIEMLEEIHDGHEDGLSEWLSEREHIQALRLEEEVDPDLVQRVVNGGYAEGLTDDQIEQMGFDPFLIAYGLADSNRCIVTTEVSKPGKKKQNRKVPDVCDTLHVKWCDPFAFYQACGFSTSWR